MPKDQWFQYSTCGMPHEA